MIDQIEGLFLDRLAEVPRSTLVRLLFPRPTPKSIFDILISRLKQAPLKGCTSRVEISKA